MSAFDADAFDRDLMRDLFLAEFETHDQQPEVNRSEQGRIRDSRPISPPLTSFERMHQRLRRLQEQSIREALRASNLTREKLRQLGLSAQKLAERNQGEESRASQELCGVDQLLVPSTSPCNVLLDEETMASTQLNNELILSGFQHWKTIKAKERKERRETAIKKLLANSEKGQVDSDDCISDSDYESDTCIVCYEQLAGGTAMVLPCAHVLCGDCLVKMLITTINKGGCRRQKACCPVCRFTLAEASKSRRASTSTTSLSSDHEVLLSDFQAIKLPPIGGKSPVPCATKRARHTY